ncbi:hypothetical protein LUZ60_001114 [Juncus effusus]|nr:hypothetical protein LUZ60_001114 [Juncus effusus]
MAAEPDRITSLFSMYADDDEDEEDEQEEAEQNGDSNKPVNPSPSSKSPLQTEEPTTDSKTLIVDYAHDEMAISPQHHGLRDGEIASGASVSENVERFKLEFSQSNHESCESEQIGLNSTDSKKDDDLLSRFLGPPVTSKCRPELQEKINRFISFKRSGRSFNDDMRNKKSYRNPDFLQHTVGYQGIDQIGSCFRKDVFDPHGYDPSDFYDEIEADMKREIERKEQERKRSPKVEFISGGTQPVPLIPILKTASSSGDAAPRETTRHKKSKWDKVESDVKNPIIPSENLSLLNAASVGAGYSGFAQQKRKEAEERRANDRKSVDRRS